jgi:hypothetical protein
MRPDATRCSLALAIILTQQPNHQTGLRTPRCLSSALYALFVMCRNGLLVLCTPLHPTFRAAQAQVGLGVIYSPVQPEKKPGPG